MKAIVCAAYGPPDVLQLEEVEKPKLRGNEILVKIHATTVTAGDAILRSLTGFRSVVFGLVFGLGRNKALGHELAVEIEAVEEAAAIPIGGNTALHIIRKGNIQSGQKVLVYGAPGSVSTYAVQLARTFGAEVTGVCGAASLELVKSLGIGKAIDYTQEDFSRSGETYDVIFDAVGKLPASRGKRALGAGGMCLSVRSPTSEKPENLIFLKDQVEAGELRPVIDRCYPLEQIAEAHAYVETGHKRGNVVITVAHSSRTKEMSE